MDQILNKVGSYWIGHKASKELNSVGSDISPLHSRCTVGDMGLLPGEQIREQLWGWLRIFRVPNDEVKTYGLLGMEAGESLGSSIEGGTKWLVNKIKGKMQKPLPDLLKEYDLPVGIFPRDATNYEFNEETRKLTVFIPAICEVGYKDSSVLRFNTTVTGYLEKGRFADIEGMKTKFVIWVKVTSITSEGSKLHFMVGMKKTRRREAYEVHRDGVSVDKF